MTRRLVLWMARQAMRRTFAEIGRDVYVDPKSVAKAFDAYTSVEIAKLHRETPRVLGIDEKKLRGEFRAAIEAMREPTPEMVDAGGYACQAHCDLTMDAARKSWAEMIDAALAEPTAPR